MGYLDYAGLQYLWGKLKEKFAPKSHSHDDRYYTESEMDGKLNSKVNNNEAGANGLLSKLSVWTATPTDDTYFMRQDTGGGNSFGRVKFSTIWSYIKSKADGVYQPKGSYAASGHTHDDRYYTETEMNGKLNEKAVNKTLSKVDLNTIKTPGFYNAGGGNGCTNVPVSDAFGLIVTHNANGEFYTQIFFLVNKNISYRRYCNSGTWSGWTQDKLTDTNTWRGIQNNLTSDSTSDSLSAAQGKVLKGLVDGKAPNGHTHTKSQVGLGNVDNTADANKSVKYATSAGTSNSCTGNAATATGIKDYGDTNKTIKIGYAGAGLTTSNLTHIAGYASNGTQIKDVSKDVLKSWIGLGNYLPLSGGTMSGQITKSNGGSWIGDRDRAAIKSGYAGDSAYGAVAAMATKNGYWTIGNLGGNESLIFNYSTDANYNAGKNETSQVYLLAQAGTIITSATIGSQSVNYANSSGSATNATTATKLSFNAGSSVQPVYFSGGKPVAIGYTISSSVPANAKFTDTTYGVASSSSNGLMSSTDKTKLDDFSRVISIQKQIKLTTDWLDTGIAGNSLDTGTYVVQVSGFNSSYTQLYSEIYSGVMSWYSGTTNSGNSSEIFLHNAGLADNNNAIYLRTLRVAGSKTLKLQIACKVTATGTDILTFKFRRLI